MRHIQSALAVGVLIAGLSISGCQTTGHKPPPNEDPEVRAVPQVPFEPQFVRVPIQLGEGRYANLFAPGSYAEWQVPIAMLKSADGETTESMPATPTGFLIIEVHVESIFPDMSIAYDVVGFRGVDVYLQTPDGRMVRPSQRSVGTELMEIAEGALRHYGRTNRVYFPAAEANLTQPAAGPGAPLRLVLQGYDSTYYFEWPAKPMPGPEKQALADRPGTQKLKHGYNEFTGRTKGFLHRFD